MISKETRDRLSESDDRLWQASQVPSLLDMIDELEARLEKAEG